MSSAADGLCVEGVHVWRGDRHVLKGVSLDLKPRELLHIRGPNGTGKTVRIAVFARGPKAAEAEVARLKVEAETLRAEALEWAATRANRSGRTAWQFIQDLAGRLGVAL